MKVSVQAEYKLFGVIKRQGDWYIAHCPPLDVTTQDRTFDEAKKNLIEASQLFIVSCLERGTLDQALKGLGFVPLKAKPTSIPNAFPISVPTPFGFEKNLPWRV